MTTFIPIPCTLREWLTTHPDARIRRSDGSVWTQAQVTSHYNASLEARVVVANGELNFVSRNGLRPVGEIVEVGA